MLTKYTCFIVTHMHLIKNTKYTHININKSTHSEIGITVTILWEIFLGDMAYDGVTPEK